MDKSVSVLCCHVDQQSHLPINVLMCKTPARACWSGQRALCDWQGSAETYHPYGCHWFPVNWMITTLACNTTVNHGCQSMGALHCHLNCCLHDGSNSFKPRTWTWTLCCAQLSSRNHTNWSGAACIRCCCRVCYFRQVIKSICCDCTVHTYCWKYIFG